MFRHTLTLLSLLIITAVSTNVYGFAVVDELFDNNQNEFEYYWYLYDDKCRLAVDDRLRAAPNSVHSRIDGVATVRGYPRMEFGDIAKQYSITEYKFATTVLSGNHVATLPFTFGAPWTNSKGTAQPYIGVGTTLYDDGKALDLTGATSIFFMARSHNGPLNVRFMIHTYEIDSISYIPIDSMQGDEFGYYGKMVTLQPEWSAIEVKIGDLTLPDTTYRNIPFNIKRCTKLVWEVQKDPNSSIVSDTMDFDNVIILGNYRNPTLTSYKPLVKPFNEYFGAGEFTTFENSVPYVNAFGYYWQAFHDFDYYDGSSKILYGATPTTYIYYRLSINNGTGCDTGKAIFLAYQIGKQNSNPNMDGCIGVRTGLYDSSTAEYWNSAKGDYKTFFFRYFTSENTGRIRFTVKDIHDVNDCIDTSRNDSRGPGVYWHKDLLGTNGEWRGVYISFSDLVCDSGLSGKPVPLDYNKLAGLEWTVEGKDGQYGIFSLDDVYFGPSAPSANLKSVAMPERSKIKAFYSNGSVHICMDKKQELLSETIRIFNAKGVPVVNIPVNRVRFNVHSIPAAHLSSGMYFLVVGQQDKNRKVSSSKSVFTILK